MRSAIVLILALHVSPALAQSCGALNEYDEILSVVSEKFFDRSFDGLDWASRVSDYRRRVTCGDGAERIALIVNDLLAKLHASHTSLYTQSDQQYWGLKSFFWSMGGSESDDAYEVSYSGIWAEEHGGEWFARFVMQDSPAARAGIVPGDRLIAIDGVSFRPLRFPRGASILTVSSDGRSTREVPIVTLTQSIMRGFEKAARASARVLNAGGKRVGYFQLWAGGARIRKIMEETLTMFESENLDALVLDLRGGYGGMGEDQLDGLRRSGVLGRIPKYFLIDDSLRSGKELLAGVIRRDGLGTLIGSRTAGQYLGASPFSIANDKYLLYLAVRGSRPPSDIPGIGPIEGVGIQPHVTVAPCWRYCGGRDPVLEKALELIAG